MSRKRGLRKARKAQHCTNSIKEGGRQLSFDTIRRLCVRQLRRLHVPEHEWDDCYQYACLEYLQGREPSAAARRWIAEQYQGPKYTRPKNGKRIDNFTSFNLWSKPPGRHEPAKPLTERLKNFESSEAIDFLHRSAPPQPWQILCAVEDGICQLCGGEMGIEDKDFDDELIGGICGYCPECRRFAFCEELRTGHSYGADEQVDPWPAIRKLNREFFCIMDFFRRTA